MARKEVSSLPAESATHTNAIINEVRKFLETRKDQSFRVGFKRGAYYLKTHAHDFFEQNTDATKRREAIDFLLNKVYEREKDLFEKFNISNDYVNGYLQALNSLPSLWRKYDNFDPSRLFQGLDTVFEEMQISVWVERHKVKQNKKQRSNDQKTADSAVVKAIEKKLSRKSPSVILGYLRSVDYLELHSRVFFEKADISERDKAITLLGEAVDAESKLFRKANERNELWQSYISGLKLLLSLLKKNKNFEPKSLFIVLYYVIGDMLKADRKSRLPLS